MKFKLILLSFLCFALCFSASATDGTKLLLSKEPVAKSTAFSAMDASDLTGLYHVRGDCGYRTVAGDYNTCVAWNELKLARTKDAEYAFGLITNSFATTQGECSVSGTLRLTSGSGRHYLVGSDSTLQMCHVRFEITETSIIFNSPGVEQCAGACGLNASLESAPFPRKLAASYMPYCEDGYYHSPDFEMKCAAKRYENADQQLNETYRNLISKLPRRSREKLRAEQRLWLKSLTANCEQATGAQQNVTDIRQGEFRDCLAQESLRRTQELVQWKVSRAECEISDCAPLRRRNNSLGRKKE